MEYVVNNFTDIINAASDITARLGGIKLWYRGQAECEWDLVPRVFRNENVMEVSINNRFINMARVRCDNAPDKSDIPAWLFLMQHYRLPTRLLDWSESILVALYFAVEQQEHNGSDGVLWALNPITFNNKQFGDSLIYTSYNDKVKKICLSTLLLGTRRTIQEWQLL